MVTKTSLPTDWEFVKAIDHIDFIRGQEPGSKHYNIKGHGQRFIRVGDLSGKREEVIFTDLSNLSSCKKSEILMSFDGSPGIVRRGFEGIYSSGIRKIILKNTIFDRNFTYYALQSSIVQDLITIHADAGTTIKHAGKSIPHIRIPAPPISEQKKIAAILSCVDDAIQATQAVIDQTRRVKQGLMQQLLTRGIGHTQFKQTEIGEIPEEWEVVSLNEMGHSYRSVIRTGPFGSSLKTIHFRSSGIPVVTIQSLGEGEILTDGLFYVDEEKATELSEYFLQTGDLVFSRVADIGRSVVISDADEKMLISSNIMRSSVDLNRFDPRFIMYSIVGGGPVTRQIEQFSGKTGRPVVSSNTMKKLNFIVPLKAEQIAIADYIQNAEEIIRAENSYVNHLTEIKRGLMQDLLTGRVRVKPDEVNTT